MTDSTHTDGTRPTRVAVGIRTSPHRVVDERGVARPYRPHINLPDQVAVEAALRTADDVVAIGKFASTDAMNAQIKDLVTNEYVRSATTDVVLDTVCEHEPLPVNPSG